MPNTTNNKILKITLQDEGQDPIYFEAMEDGLIITGKCGAFAFNQVGKYFALPLVVGQCPGIFDLNDLEEDDGGIPPLKRLKYPIKSIK